MKTKMMCEIRVFTGYSRPYSRLLSPRLRELQTGMRLVQYLRKRYGIEAFVSDPIAMKG